MKINKITSTFTTAKPSLSEGSYRVKIKNFTHQEVEGEKGYYRLDFDVIGEKRVGSMNIFPGNVEFALNTLADKTEKEFDDTDELKGEEIELYYSHTYTNRKTGQTIRKKQFDFYDPNTRSVPADNGTKDDINEADLPK